MLSCYCTMIILATRPSWLTSSSLWRYHRHNFAKFHKFDSFYQIYNFDKNFTIWTKSHKIDNISQYWQNFTIFCKQCRQHRQWRRCRHLWQLGPSRPSAGGPRTDRRKVTSSGVAKISHLVSRQRRSARRGDSVIKNRYWPLAKTVWLKTITDSLPRQFD